MATRFINKQTAEVSTMDGNLRFEHEQGEKLQIIADAGGHSEPVILNITVDDLLELQALLTSFVKAVAK